MGTQLQVVEQVYKLVDAGDVGGLRGLLTEDVEIEAPGAKLTGIDAAVAFYGSFLTAFPDSAHSLRASVESGSDVATEWTATGTNSGPVTSPGGEIPATGKTLQLRYGQFDRFEVGRVRRTTLYWDYQDFLTQLGLL
jgi:steroid delta-isomerase-like uncharacterized protein